MTKYNLSHEESEIIARSLLHSAEGFEQMVNSGEFEPSSVREFTKRAKTVRTLASRFIANVSPRLVPVEYE
jgi:hypothetical protein